ncbi:MAG: hypothetical protein Q9184_002801 [Pyrenodesmia sp. 2 TL-2023]
MAPTPSKQAKLRDDFPIFSTSKPQNGGDFVPLDKEQRDIELDGDQTKYIPPTLTQSLTASIKLAVDGVIREPLTKKNLMRNTAPLAQDLALVTKQGLGVAAGWAGEKLMKIGGAATAYGQAVALKSNTSVKSSTSATAHRPNTQSNLSDSENAISNALLDGKLHTAGKDSEEVKAFLANLREEQATTKREAGAFDDDGGGC